MKALARLRATGRALRASAPRGLLVAIPVVALVACQRESRDFEPPSRSITPPVVRLSVLQPGASSTIATAGPDSSIERRYESNAQALSEGKRLFGWYNCSGCHANGGGDKGPALMDNVWIYGSEPAQIYRTIVEGRPNGMPSFGGHIPDNEVWEIVAYVRSLSGLASSGAAPSRSDSMHVKEPESQAEKKEPPAVVAPAGRP